MTQETIFKIKNKNRKKTMSIIYLYNKYVLADSFFHFPLEYVRSGICNFLNRFSASTEEMIQCTPEEDWRETFNKNKNKQLNNVGNNKNSLSVNFGKQ